MLTELVNAAQHSHTTQLTLYLLVRAVKFDRLGLIISGCTPQARMKFSAVKPYCEIKD